MNASYQQVPEALRVQLDPRAPEFYRNPYAQYSHWHQTHPVFYWEDYGLWCVCGFNDVSSILRDQRFGRQVTHLYSREELGLPAPKPHLKDFYRLEQYSLLNLEAPEHTRLRKFVMHAFTHRRVQQLDVTIQSLTNNLLDDLEKTIKGTEQSFDLLAHYATPLAAGVIARLVGAPESSIPDLLQWSHRLVRVYTLTQSHEEEVDANQAAIEFREFLLQLIAERRDNPAEDLITLLLQAGDDSAGSGQKDHPSDEEIVSIVVLLLNAGHEATVHQIGNAVYQLLSNTRTPADFFANDQSARNAVLELMRVDTPLHLFTRYALEPVSLALGNQQSLQLAAGEEVALLLGAANHDPLLFDSPELFNPERAKLDSVSLGAGTHFCVGALLAQLEIRIALQNLFARFPHLTLATEPEVADTFHFKGFKELQVSCQSKRAN